MELCKRCHKREIDISRSKRHCSICADKYIEYGKNQSLEYKRQKTKRWKTKKLLQVYALDVVNFHYPKTRQSFVTLVLLKQEKTTKKDIIKTQRNITDTFTLGYIKTHINYLSIKRNMLTATKQK